MMSMNSKQLTIVLLGLFAGLMLIFAGCMVKQGSEKITNAPAPVEEIEEPVLENLTDEVLGSPKEPVGVNDTEGMRSTGDRLEDNEVVPIGTRVLGAENRVEQGTLEESETTVFILPEKVMSETEVTITEGTVLTWQNKDDAPHMIKIEQGTTLLQQGPRMEKGDTFSYLFNKEGTYLARDIFSGNARMTVTVNQK
ncbi:MAG: hypothetical protein ACE5DM_01330 [Candidatus Nanoarchaeia archaeon]